MNNKKVERKRVPGRTPRQRRELAVSSDTDAEGSRRNQNFSSTHRLMIETTVRLISEHGAQALSIAALARVMKMNRSTVYYHFDSRDALIAAVRAWSGRQLSLGVKADVPRRERIDHISRFVLENPEVIKLFIDDFIAVGDIRERYPLWDKLVRGMSATLRSNFPGEEVDPEVYCVLILTGAFIGPRVFKNSVRPAESIDVIVERFRKEQQRMLRLDALVPIEGGAKPTSDTSVVKKARKT